MATTTNHTHTFASLTDKPTTISGYGITDAYTASTIDSKLSGYLPLGGGILNANKSIGFSAYSAFSGDGGGGWAVNAINLYDRVATKRFGGLGYFGSYLNLGYIYLGTESFSGVNLRIYGTGQSDLKWGDNAVLHSGNYNSYCPKLDGTGATGTWGISISGNAATATNADTLDGFHESSFSRHVEGVVFAVNTTRYYKLGNLPQSSTSTYDAFLIQGGIGGFLSSQKAVLNVSVGRREGVIFCGYTQGLWQRNLGIDIGINDAGEIVLIVTGSWCAWTLDLHTIQGTISYTGTTFTPTDTNFVLLSASNNVSKSLADGTVEKATKLATSRTIWGQSFDGTGNVDGSIKIKDNVGLYHLTPDGVYRCYVGYDTNNLYVHIYNFSSGSSIRINDDGNICIPSGNVGIGTTSPSYKLHIVGTAYASENIIASGDLTAGSDIRYKDKIQDLRLTVHDIALAPAFTYKWNNREDDALVHIGSSAQYWLNTNAKDAVYYDKKNDFYHLNYASLALCNTIILARGMETQEEKIARLEERIKELEDKLRQYDSYR